MGDHRAAQEGAGEGCYKALNVSSARTASRPTTARYSRFRIARAALNRRETPGSAAFAIFRIRLAELRRQVRLFRRDRGAQRHAQINDDEQRHDDAGRRDRQADADDRRAQIKRMPRQPVRPGHRHLSSLLEVPRRPDPHALADRGDDRADRQRARRRVGEPERGDAGEEAEGHPPSRQELQHQRSFRLKPEATQNRVAAVARMARAAVARRDRDHHDACDGPSRC